MLEIVLSKAEIQTNGHGSGEPCGDHKYPNPTREQGTGHEGAPRRRREGVNVVLHVGVNPNPFSAASTRVATGYPRSWDRDVSLDLEVDYVSS